MQKVISLLLSILFLMGATAHADVNLSDMSQEELLTLRYEIDKKVGYPVLGTYVTGVDIKEGYYILTATPDRSTYVSIYPDLDAGKRGRVEDLLSIFLLNKGTSTTVHLEGNNVIMIQSGALLIPMPEPSWKP